MAWFLYEDVETILVVGAKAATAKDFFALVALDKPKGECICLFPIDDDDEEAARQLLTSLAATNNNPTKLKYLESSPTKRQAGS